MYIQLQYHPARAHKHTRPRKIQDKTAASTCWPLGLQPALLPLAAVVFKFDNCFTRLPCGLLWGPVTGKRIFHPGRSKLGNHISEV